MKVSDDTNQKLINLQLKDEYKKYEIEKENKRVELVKKM